MIDLTTDVKWALFGLWTLACLVTGYCIHGWWDKPVAVPPAAPHELIRYVDGAATAARLPTAPVPPVAAPAPPPAQHVAATAHIVITPHATKPCPVPPLVALDETLSRDKTGNLDLTLKSPDGYIDTATLTPIADPTPLVPPVHPWAVGGSVGSNRMYGVFVDRDLGPIRVGAEINQSRDTGLEGRLKVGWRF